MSLSAKPFAGALMDMKAIMRNSLTTRKEVQTGGITSPANREVNTDGGRGMNMSATKFHLQVLFKDGIEHFDILFIKKRNGAFILDIMDFKGPDGVIYVPDIVTDNPQSQDRIETGGRGFGFFIPISETFFRQPFPGEAEGVDLTVRSIVGMPYEIGLGNPVSFF